tara:strand:- start:39 stop:548 length:510 start_codon:yes stop_codon:yes gene_type:complete
MNKISGVGIAVGIALVIGIIAYQANDAGLFVTKFADDFTTVGPLTIDKQKYVLGENVFVWMNLHPLENGTITFIRPDGHIHYEANFNGSKKPDPQFYFRPTLERPKDICEKEDVIGTWTVLITGKTLTSDQKNLTNVPKELKFEFVDKILPGSEKSWEGNVCEAPQELG